jgi:hypothetical protein
MQPAREAGSLDEWPLGRKGMKPRSADPVTDCPIGMRQKKPRTGRTQAPDRPGSLEVHRESSSLLCLHLIMPHSLPELRCAGWCDGKVYPVVLLTRGYALSAQ